MCYDVKEDYLQLRLRLTPSAGSNRIGGSIHDCLKVSLTAPPDKGKANKALMKLLSRSLNIPKHRIKLIRGVTAREKTVSIRGADAETRERINALIRGNGEPPQ